MIMNRDIIIVAMILGLSIGMCLSIERCSRNADRADRLESNEKALTDTLSSYRALGKNISSRQSVTVSGAKELKQVAPREVSEAKKLGIKAKRISSVRVAGTVTRTVVVTKVDTVWKEREGANKALWRNFHWSDGYFIADGEISPSDSLRMTVTARDTITMIAHRVPKRFLWIPYGTRSIRVEMWGSNPNSAIDYARDVEMTK